MHDEKRMAVYCRLYFLLGAIEAIGMVVALLLIPADPKNAWILGYSKARIAMMTIGGILIACFVYLGVKGWHHSLMRSCIYSWVRLETSIIVVSLILGVVIAICLWIVIMGVGVFGEWPYQAYGVRLAPLAMMVILLGIQTLLLVLYIRVKKDGLRLANVVVRLPLAVLFVLGITLYRVVYLYKVYSMNDLYPDVQTYRVIANGMRHLYDTGIREPVWIWTVKVFLVLFGDSDATFRFLGLILFLVTGYFLYRLVRETFDDRYVALLTLAFFSWNEFLLSIALNGLRDNLFTLAVVGLAYFTFSKSSKMHPRIRILGLNLFYILAVGTRVTSMFSLGVIMFYAFWRNRLRYRTILVTPLLVAVVIGPYLAYSAFEFGDPMYSANVHAVWWRNYEFVVLKGTGCDGCPTPEEFRANPYSGKPTTMTHYIFGMHSAKELIIGNLKGLKELYFSPSRVFANMLGVSPDSNALLTVMIVYALGIVVLAFKNERWLLLVPVIVTNLLAFFVFIMPYRLYSHNAPFMSIFAAQGLTVLGRCVYKSVWGRNE